MISWYVAAQSSLADGSFVAGPAIALGQRPGHDGAVLCIAIQCSPERGCHEGAGFSTSHTASGACRHLQATLLVTLSLDSLQTTSLSENPAQLPLGMGQCSRGSGAEPNETGNGGKCTLAVLQYSCCEQGSRSSAISGAAWSSWGAVLVSNCSRGTGNEGSFWHRDHPRSACPLRSQSCSPWPSWEREREQEQVWGTTAEEDILQVNKELTFPAQKKEPKWGITRGPTTHL